LDAATIFMVFVIRWIDFTEARRRRSAFTLAMSRSPEIAAACAGIRIMAGATCDEEIRQKERRGETYRKAG
jgi:hypothetical protein